MYGKDTGSLLLSTAVIYGKPSNKLWESVGGNENAWLKGTAKLSSTKDFQVLW